MLALHQLWSQGQQVILSYKDEASMSQHAELWPSIPYWWGNQVKPRDLVHYLELMKSCSHPGECRLQTRTPGHTHVLVHGAGFGFKWRNGTGRIRGRYSVSHMGTRAWTSLGMLLCPPQGLGCRQDVDIHVNIIVSTTRGQDMDIFGVTVQPTCPV